MATCDHHSVHSEIPLGGAFCAELSNYRPVTEGISHVTPVETAPGTPSKSVNPMVAKVRETALLHTRTIRRHELRQIVPVADTTIYEMEQRGEFPRRFYLTSRCVVWNLAEVEAWLEQRRRDSDAKLSRRAPAPDVRLRKTRPVKR